MEPMNADANGTIDLGQLSGITAVAAGVDASGGAVRVDYQSGRRRRYCWRLPSVLTGSCNPDRHAGEQEDSAGAFGTELRLRALAAGSDGSNVQVTWEPGSPRSGGPRCGGQGGIVAFLSSAVTPFHAYDFCLF